MQNVLVSDQNVFITQKIEIELNFQVLEIEYLNRFAIFDKIVSDLKTADTEIFQY